LLLAFFAFAHPVTAIFVFCSSRAPSCAMN
jgi:hypothetical protein